MRRTGQGQGALSKALNERPGKKTIDDVVNVIRAHDLWSEKFRRNAQIRAEKQEARRLLKQEDWVSIEEKDEKGNMVRHWLPRSSLTAKQKIELAAARYSLARFIMRRANQCAKDAQMPLPFEE